MYQEGHIKHDPETNSVAIRTVFPDDQPAYADWAWIVSGTSRGASCVPTSEVESWGDLYAPPETVTDDVPVIGPGDPTAGGS
jgi:hypothetical protein